MGLKSGTKSIIGIRAVFSSLSAFLIVVMGCGSPTKASLEEFFVDEIIKPANFLDNRVRGSFEVVMTHEDGLGLMSKGEGGQRELEQDIPYAVEVSYDFVEIPSRWIENEMLPKPPVLFSDSVNERRVKAVAEVRLENFQALQHTRYSFRYKSKWWCVYGGNLDTARSYGKPEEWQCTTELRSPVIDLHDWADKARYLESQAGH